MAVRWLDSFQGYTGAQIGLRYETAGGVDISTVSAARTGSQCMNLGYPGFFGKLFPDGPTTIIQGIALYPNYPMGTASDSFLPVFSLYDLSGNRMITIGVSPTGSLIVVTGWANNNSATLGATASGVIRSFVFQMIEWKVVASTTASGSVSVQVNGFNVLTVTGVITANLANGTTSNQVGVASFGDQRGVNWFQSSVNDYYIFDGTGATNNTFAGDVRVNAVFPSAPGRVAAWAVNGSGGTNWGSVNTVPPGTNFVSSSTIGAADAYKLSPLPAVPAVLAVQASIFANKSDAGTRSIAIGVGNGVTENYDAGNPQLTSAKYYTRPLDINPLTGVAWTPSDFLSLQAAIKVV